MLDKNFIFKKFPICPPINTIKKRGQKFKNSLKTISFVNCPATPKIEFIKIKREAAVVICFGYPALIKNKNGLKNIPPPIPIIPEINPIIEPIVIDKIFGNCLIFILFLLNDLLSINKSNPAKTKTKNNNISNSFFSIEIEAPKKVNGIDPIRYGMSNLRFKLPDLT